MTRQKKCICTLPEHGTYIKCKTCNNEFHPDCIGIKVMKEKQLEIDKRLECWECNPNNPTSSLKKKTGLQTEATQDPIQETKHKPNFPEEVLITHALNLTSNKQSKIQNA
jgi:hypothetical protein